MMKLIAVLATLGVALAQGPGFGGPGGPGRGMMMGGPRAAQQQPSFTELKSALGLTDANIQAIQQAQQSVMTNVQTLMTSIQTKEQSLHDLLDKGTTDAAAVGKLMLDIALLQKQVKTAHDSASTAAVNLLSADQKTKLAALQNAANLMPAIQQAGALGLLQPPSSTTGGMGPGMGGMRPFGFRPRQ
jgi:Spy/CpxP family protein refolding chaperone